MSPARCRTTAADLAPSTAKGSLHGREDKSKPNINMYNNSNKTSSCGTAVTPMLQTMEEKHQFSFFLAPAKQVKPFRTMNVKQAFDYIISDMDATIATHNLREIHDPKEHRLFKSRNFAFATFSGVFSYRSDKMLLKHSGLLCLDFDHLGNVYRIWELKERLLRDQNFQTALAFTSPSGDGLKWVIEIDINKADHKTWFNAVANYVKQQYRLDVDPQCANVSRACFLPHDPFCWER